MRPYGPAGEVVHRPFTAGPRPASNQTVQLLGAAPLRNHHQGELSRPGDPLVLRTPSTARRWDRGPRSAPAVKPRFRRVAVLGEDRPHQRRDDHHGHGESQDCVEGDYKSHIHSDALAAVAEPPPNSADNQPPPARSRTPPHTAQAVRSPGPAKDP